MTGNVHAEYMFITDIKSVWMQKITGGKKKKNYSYGFVFKKASLSSNFNEDIKGNPKVACSLKNFSNCCKTISCKSNLEKNMVGKCEQFHD